MWVAEFKVWHKGSETAEVTRHFDVTMESHYLNVFFENGREYVTKAISVHGKDSQKAMAALVGALETDGIRSVAIEGSHAFFIAKAVKQFHSAVIGSNAFFVGPQVLRGGYNYWKVASWDKNNLLALYEKIRKLPKSQATIELLGIKKQRVQVFASSVLNSLTEKQREAFEFACRSGYYECPRRVSLEQLAASANMAYTTFKDRLRAAEGKLWPALTN